MKKEIILNIFGYTIIKTNEIRALNDIIHGLQWQLEIVEKENQMYKKSKNRKIVKNETPTN